MTTATDTTELLKQEVLSDEDGDRFVIVGTNDEAYALAALAAELSDWGVADDYDFDQASVTSSIYVWHTYPDTTDIDPDMQFLARPGEAPDHAGAVVSAAFAAVLVTW